MIDAALIQQCADKTLKLEIVEMFIERAGSQDPLAVTVRSGKRVVLVPKPTTPDEALSLIRNNLGRNTVRVGITQYPAGLGLIEAGQLKPDLIEPCENIRMGTALFGKVYRIVTRWYGNPTAKDVLPQVFDDAIIAWQTGYFEGKAVFTATDPGAVRLAEPKEDDQDIEPPMRTDGKPQDLGGRDAPPSDGASDPSKAGMRVDLSGIGSSR
ncbi:conjugal transfer protein TraH (plasmid) [Rhizobium sp. B230/85]|uniref:TraH family protein n=1 Tax=unclassified Rhizobium TaxID=2613769 RepID=UPI001AD96824|nr:MULTISPECIES: TraH family protein [unclassified Rhizobium]MBO9136742.1 conjugal transfer protein TraH [Rhizobium sp. B209b/85]QXZ99582.1 conjugal transfer protein TraH [Rhizobium sp. B230/85]